MSAIFLSDHEVEAAIWIIEKGMDKYGAMPINIPLPLRVILEKANECYRNERDYHKENPLCDGSRFKSLLEYLKSEALFRESIRSDCEFRI